MNVNFTLDMEILTFADRQAFRDWLGKNGALSSGIWLRFSKNQKLVTLSADEALEEALCHGWIDGQMQSLDDNTYRKYFARRIPKSKWSAKNIKSAQTLIEKGLMTPQGFEAIENARKLGLWEPVERNPIDDHQIQMFKEIIQSYGPAFANLLAMSPSVQRTYTGYYYDAKSDKTRQARLEKIVDRLNKNLKPM